MSSALDLPMDVQAMELVLSPLITAMNKQVKSILKIFKVRRKNMAEKRLSGKIAIVTGANTAIGAAVVKKFADEGAKVAFCGSCEEGGQELLKKTRDASGEGLFVKLDIANQDEVKAFVKKASDTYGDVDLLVTVPVVKQNKAFVELTEQDWVELMEKDGLGAIYAMWEVLPSMKNNRKGSILNITSYYGSEAGYRAAFNAYFMAGMHNMMKCISMEYSPWGIRANALSPGLIIEEDQDLTKEEVFQAIGDDTLRRAGTPEEVANAALWLSSDEASYVTGAVINVNGGAISRGLETKTWLTGETEFLRDFERVGEAKMNAFER
jgi:3-oxoacyl-[acyl-carrier protein] reductase